MFPLDKAGRFESIAALRDFQPTVQESAMLKQTTANFIPFQFGEEALAASRQVWLASLGAAAVTRDWMQTEATKTFKTLVKEGTVVESRAVSFDRQAGCRRRGDARQQRAAEVAAQDRTAWHHRQAVEGEEGRDQRCSREEGREEVRCEGYEEGEAHGQGCRVIVGTR
jgi:hypothetical protein